MFEKHYHLLGKIFSYDLYLHRFSLSFVEKASPRLVIDLPDRLDDASQTLLQLGQKIEKLLRHLSYHSYKNDRVNIKA